MSLFFVGDVNGDGRADIVCVASSGGVTVWESKDTENFYEPSNLWMDQNFGFCNANDKLVSVNTFYVDLLHKEILTFWMEMITLLYNLVFLLSLITHWLN